MIRNRHTAAVTEDTAVIGGRGFTADETSEALEAGLRARTHCGNIIVRTTPTGDYFIGFAYPSTEPHGALRNLQLQSIRSLLEPAFQSTPLPRRESPNLLGSFPLVLSAPAALAACDYLARQSGLGR